MVFKMADPTENLPIKQRVLIQEKLLKEFTEKDG